MRILFVTHTWPPEGRGGTELHARSVALGLLDHGHAVGVFTRTGDAGRPAYEVTTGSDGRIGITRINHLFADDQTVESIYKNARVHEAFERELDEFKPDLVHIHHLTGLSTTLIETLKLRRIPVVMTLHDFWTICPRGQRIHPDLTICEAIDRERCFACLGGLWPHLFGDRAAERTIVDIRGGLAPDRLAEWDRNMVYALRLCDLLICPSEFHRERMLDFPLDPERILSLPHGMDGAHFDAPPRPPKPVRTIAYLGAVIPVKGVHVLIEAFQRLGRRDLRLEIHGTMPSFHEDRDYGERLRAATADWTNISFHGAYPVEEVPRILESVDLVVVPSIWWESFCLTLREGILAGVPVVASDLGAMREALDGERCGLLFRPGDPEDLRRKLERLIEDDELRGRLANQGHRVKAMDPYLGELHLVYEKALALSRVRADALVVAPPHFADATREGVAEKPAAEAAVAASSAAAPARTRRLRRRRPRQGGGRSRAGLRREPVRTAASSRRTALRRRVAVRREEVRKPDSGLRRHPPSGALLRRGGRGQRG